MRKFTPRLTPSPLVTTVYTQVELPPLIPRHLLQVGRAAQRSGSPYKGGKQENLVPSPFQGEG